MILFLLPKGFQRICKDKRRQKLIDRLYQNRHKIEKSGMPSDRKTGFARRRYEFPESMVVVETYGHQGIKTLRITGNGLSETLHPQDKGFARLRRILEGKAE